MNVYSKVQYEFNYQEKFQTLQSQHTIIHNYNASFTLH